MIKKFLLRLYLKLKNDDCVIYGNATKRTIFFGGNYIGRNTHFDGEMGYATNIGNNCIISAKIGKYTCIGHNVSTIVATHPLAPFVSIHPAFFTTRKVPYEKFSDYQLFNEYKYYDCEKKYAIEIGNDVWIGNNVLIMGGVQIGDGAVIGAGAIVTKNIEPYSINVGIPSKKIKMRFSDDDILFLNDLKWWNKDKEWIKNHSVFFTDINELKKYILNEGKMSNEDKD